MAAQLGTGEVAWRDFVPCGHDPDLSPIEVFLGEPDGAQHRPGACFGRALGHLL
jgi:hypothetical protein